MGSATGNVPHPIKKFGIGHVNHPLPVNQRSLHSLPSGDFSAEGDVVLFGNATSHNYLINLPKRTSFCSEMNGDRVVEFLLSHD